VANLPAAISFLGFYHDFEADRLGADYGKEIDLQLSRNSANGSPVWSNTRSSTAIPPRSPM
jgi:hypothetical protein